MMKEHSDFTGLKQDCIDIYLGKNDLQAGYCMDFAGVLPWTGNSGKLIHRQNVSHVGWVLIVMLFTNKS